MGRLWMGFTGYLPRQVDVCCRELVKVGVTDLMPFVNGDSASDERFELQYPGSYDALLEHARVVSSFGMRLHPMIWARGNIPWMTDAGTQMAELSRKAARRGVSLGSVVLDAEGTYRLGRDVKRDPSGFVEIVRAAWDAVECPVSVTSLGVLPPPVAPLVSWATSRPQPGSGIAQAYSFRRPDEATILANRTPETFSVTAAKSWRPHAHGHLVILSASYGEPFPAWSFEDALAAQLYSSAQQAPGDGIGIWHYDTAFDVATGRPRNSVSAQQIRALLLQAARTPQQITYRAVTFADSQRADLSRKRGWEIDVLEYEQGRLTPSVLSDLAEHAVETFPTAGRLYDFNTGTWR